MSAAHRNARAVAEARALSLLQHSKRRWPGAKTYSVAALDGLIDRYGSAVDAFLVLSHAHLTALQQSEMLAVSRRHVHYWRSLLIKRGCIDPTERASHRPITSAEAESFARLRRAGWTIKAIAELRGVNTKRVDVGLRMAGIPHGIHLEFLTIEDVAHLFTTNRSTVRFWIDAGWLPDLRPRRIDNDPSRNDNGAVTRFAQHRWSRHDIVVFIRERETWIAWEPTQVTDPELRTLAERERTRAGGAWWQLIEIARWLGIAGSTLSTWRRNDGLFPDCRQWSGGRYVWLTHSQRAEIQALGAAVQALPHRSDQRRWSAVAMREKLRAAYAAR